MIKKLILLRTVSNSKEIISFQPQHLENNSVYLIIYGWQDIQVWYTLHRLTVLFVSRVQFFVQTASRKESL